MATVLSTCNSLEVAYSPFDLWRSKSHTMILIYSIFATSLLNFAVNSVVLGFASSHFVILILALCRSNIAQHDQGQFNDEVFSLSLVLIETVGVIM